MMDEAEVEVETIQLTIQLPRWIVSRIELVCEHGIFRDVSEFIAYASRNAIKEMLKMLKDDLELRNKYRKELYPVEE